ncbi:MAG: chloride channel protein, partial [Thaumarchaeota archaeon]
YARRWILLDILGCVVGILGGLGAVFFRLMISINHTLFFDGILRHIPLRLGGVNFGVILLPALGGLIIGPIIMRLAPETKGHGVPEVMEAATLRGGRIRKRVAFIKVIVSSITIGSGGSAGREGPIAQIGATLGSIIGQVFKLDAQSMKLLVVCGLAAGIAGTFNAPLGGALFGMEILYRGIGLFNAMPVILSSVIGATVASVFLGRKPAFNPEGLTTWTPQELPLYLLLGVVFGIISIIWVKVFYAVEDFFERLNISPHLKPAIGGLIVGLIGVLYAGYGIMGVGYEGINLLLAGKLTLILLILLGILKILATSFTIGSGGSGGIFAPSLYIGSMFGGALGILFHMLFPSIVTQPVTYALAGMAALFAGAAQAPINVIIMIPEMSGTFTLIPPIMASSTMSFFIAWLILRGSSIYTIKLERRGIKLRMGRSFILDSIRVEEVMNRNIITLSPDMPILALETLFEEYHHTGYPVVKDGKLIGMVTISDVQKVPPEKRANLKIKDIASRKLVVTYPDETVHQALDKMYIKDVGRLPVVDRNDPTKIVGIISKHDILKAFELAARREIEEAAEGV